MNIPASNSLFDRLRSKSSAWMAAACFLWLAATAGLRPLMLPDEGRYVSVAREMLRVDDWAVPLLDGMPFFHKPPLFYWITEAGLKLFGPHEWAGRLSPLLGATLAAFALHAFLRRHRGGGMAAAAVLILVTQPLFFFSAQYANMDMLVASLISAAILAAADAVLRAEKGEAWQIPLLLAYAAAALGMLAKGLIGFVLPGGVLFFWLLASGRWRRIAFLLWPPGLALFLALGLPWFIEMQRRYYGFFDYFVIYQHFRRFTQAGFNNAFPFWFYLPVLLVTLLPWSPWLLALKRKAFWREPGKSDLRLLMAIWFALVFVFFSLPTSKLVGYILPTLPPLAALIADAVWQTDASTRHGRLLKATIGIAAAICLAVVVSVTYYIGNSAKPLAKAIAADFAPTDQVAMLYTYQYDLAFYLPLARPAWVIGNWDDPAFTNNDNWRKELADAGAFAPATRDAVLLTPSRFLAASCNLPQGSSLWIWGDAAAAPTLASLGSPPAHAVIGKKAVWRIKADAAFRAAHCAPATTR